MLREFNNKKLRSINLRGQVFSFDTPKIMGILNLTPDSFYDGGKYQDIDEILLHVEKMILEGADFIDIGASSTRPGAQPIPAEMELKRLFEPVKQIRNSFPKIFISIDTYYSKVAQRMVGDSGVDMINDISAGLMDEKMFEAIARLNVPYIIMHMQGTPEVMQENPSYVELVKEVIKFLADRIDQLNLLGVNDVIADPGFGFGKTLNQNYDLLANLDVFSLLEVPLLVGLSRKSMIYKLLNCTSDESLNGTSIVHTMALINGANILRVHDIKQARETISIVSKLNEFSNPGLRG